MNDKSIYSKFWLNEDDLKDTSSGHLSSNEKKAKDFIKMASCRRAIANFVSILTEKQIPVVFHDGDESLTDGKKVIISADFSEENFDPMVGLALHEGSHIVKSDFNLIRDLFTLVPHKIYEKAGKKGLKDKAEVLKLVQMFLNIVEDRYIDDFVYSTAPGYRGYYIALYDKYFRNPIVDKALKSKEYTTEDIDSYLFRLINMTNKNTNLDALKSLRKIEKMIDLTDIKRLKTPKDRMRVAFEISEAIFESIDYVTTKPKALMDNPSDAEDLLDGDSGKSTDSKKKSKKGGVGKEIVISSCSEGEGEEGELSEKQIEELKDHFQKQKDFIKGIVEKSQITKEEMEELSAIEESGTTLVVVGKEIKNQTFSERGVECVVVKNMTQRIVDSPEFPLRGRYTRYCNQNYINDGIRLGTVLGKRLQVRGEIRDTKYLRQNNGKIEKRLINGLGYDCERVFSQVTISKYKKAQLHITVDASGSMEGTKWVKTMTCVVAICKAASMIQNLRVVVSFRTCNSDGHNTHPLPYIVIAYDSAKDKFVKIKSFFSKLFPGGSTPEGLAFEAILELIPSSNAECDSYFLNFSDGEPCFNRVCGYSYKSYEYSGDCAAKHTKQQVEKIKKCGIKVLSYFIEESSNRNSANLWTTSYNDPEYSRKLFKKMYGSDSRFIDVTNVLEVSKTMNAKFLDR